MTFRTPAILAVLALVGPTAEMAVAQPIAPPRRPTFSSYGSLFYPGGGYGYGGGGYGYGGGGMGGNIGWMQQQQQNLLLQRQLTSFNQNLTNIQTFLATGVNPNFPVTGHAAVFNNLGHWYGGIGGAGGSLVTGRTAGIGIPVGPAASTAPAAAGANVPRTAGTGIPIGSPRKQ